MLEKLRLHFGELPDQLHHRALGHAAGLGPEFLRPSRRRPALDVGWHLARRNAEPDPEPESADLNDIAVVHLLPIDPPAVNQNSVTSQKIDHPQPAGGQHEAGVNPRYALVPEPDVA